MNRQRLAQRVDRILRKEKWDLIVELERIEKRLDEIDDNLERLYPEVFDIVPSRPKVRGQCLQGGSNESRPCVFASCRYNTAIQHLGRRTIRWHPDAVLPGGEVDLTRLRVSCALDAAEEGRKTFGQLAPITGWTRERVRQIELKAIRKIRQHETLK